jgi:predicted dehydrogenase/nucleoside-diphosphate-sugar epimerase
MRVALVGCGKIAFWHVSALKHAPGVDIVAVCDRNKDLAERIAVLAGGASVYTDFAELLRQERPGAVHVLTPPNTHAPLAIQAMEAGCHVMVEKPFALSTAEVDTMQTAAQRHGVRLCAVHNYLYKPSIARARELVASGAIGDVVHVDGFYGLSGEGGSYAGAGGRTHWAFQLPGGAFTNFLPHLLYLQLAFLKHVDAVAGVTLGYPPKPAGAAATEMTVLLQGERAAGTMTFSMRTSPYAKFVDIYGTKGIVHADLVREVCTVHKNWQLPRMLTKVLYNLEDSVQLTTGTIANTFGVLSGSLKNMPGLHVLVHEFYESIRTNSTPPIDAEDSRHLVEVMEKVWDRTRELEQPAPAPTAPQAPQEPQTDAERRVAAAGIPDKVLVTGATGFLGHRLVAALARCGVEVVALVRDPGQASPELAQQATLIAGDLRDRAALETAMQGVSVVFHCAAVTTNNLPWNVHYETNVSGSEHVFAAALKAGVRQVIHVSSVVVYGVHQARSNGRITEDTPYVQNSDRWAYYLRSKLEADRLAFRYAHEHNLPVTVIRPGILYGPGGGRAPGRGLGQVGPLRLMVDGGNNHLPYTYVDNTIDCMLLAAITPEAIGQAYNVVDEPQLRLHDVASKSMAITGEHANMVPVPSALLTGAASYFEAKQKRANSDIPPKLSNYVVHSIKRDVVYDTGKARRELGWTPVVTLEEGMRRTHQANEGAG